MNLLYSREGHNLSIKRGRALVAITDALYGEFLKSELETDGYDVVRVDHGLAVMEQIYQENWQLIIVDYGMIGISGLEICRRIRLVSRTPIIMTAKQFSPSEIVAALDCGADACFLRRTSSEEILAYARALLRRIHWESVPCHDVDANILRFKDIELNQVTFTVRQGDRFIDLSDREFQLLATLMGHVDIVLKRRELIRWIWGYPDEVETKVLESYIQKLRRKLDTPDAPHSYITTIRNIGYVMRTLTID